jgi:transcriptional regulator with XRE-family HTH domain
MRAMRINRDEEAEAFAARLQKAANLRGLTSGRSRSGVDVTALAAAIDASYEMARRYAEGLAMPKPEMVRVLARWLKVSPSWLAYGEGDMEAPADLDVVLLEECIKAVTDAQKDAGVQLDNERQANLVAGLYREARDGKLPSVASVAVTIKALAR